MVETFALSGLSFSGDWQQMPILRGLQPNSRRFQIKLQGARTGRSLIATDAYVEVK